MNSSGTRDHLTSGRAGTPLRVVLCPQEFKGSLGATDVTAAMAHGVRAVLPDCEIVSMPMADGGPGTAEIVAAASGAQLQLVQVEGPLAKPVQARVAWLASPVRTAVVESAQAAGLSLIPAADLDPGRASTLGVGQLIAHALASGAAQIVVGVGGTCTNDGGAGALQALGARLLDGQGSELAGGGTALVHLDRIDPAGLAGLRSGAVRIRVAVDVRNPLLGPQGATAVYGPQKGVTPEQAPHLEAGLARFAACCERDLGVDIASVQGAGAGGGLAGGLLALGANICTVESGAELVADAIRLPASIRNADLVISGEGRLDGQTAYGKTVAHVAELCRRSSVPCVCVAGMVDDLPADVRDAEAAALSELSLHANMARAAALVVAATARLVRRHLEQVV